MPIAKANMVLSETLAMQLNRKQDWVIRELCLLWLWRPVSFSSQNSDLAVIPSPMIRDRNVGVSFECGLPMWASPLRLLLKGETAIRSVILMRLYWAETMRVAVRTQHLMWSISSTASHVLHFSCFQYAQVRDTISPYLISCSIYRHRLSASSPFGGSEDCY